MVVPAYQFVMSMPDSLVRSKRLHAKLVKEQVRRRLVDHWRNVIPAHFEKSAHQKYGYRARSLKYMKQKAHRYHSTTDLVKTGATEQLMKTQAQVTVSGTVESGNVNGRLILRFPFRGGTRHFYNPGSHQAIQIEEMASEIETITPYERMAMITDMHNGYASAVRTETTSRQRIRI